MARNTTETAVNSRVNNIVEGTSLKGEIVSQGNFRIDGSVEGDIRIEGRLIIGAKGRVKGTVTCKDADIEGNFDGDIEVKGLLSLKATSMISGEAVFQRLMVEEGAKLTCTCNLGKKSGQSPSTAPRLQESQKEDSLLERSMSAIQ